MPGQVLHLRVRALEEAIRRHRDARGHGRCWENDRELYALLDEPVPGGPELPTQAEFMVRCAAYYAEQARGVPGTRVDERLTPAGMLRVVECLRFAGHQGHRSYAASRGTTGERCYVCGDGYQEVIDALRAGLAAAGAPVPEPLRAD